MDNNDVQYVFYDDITGYLLFNFKGKNAKSACQYFKKEIETLFLIVSCAENQDEFDFACMERLIGLTMGTTRQEYQIEMYCRQVKLGQLVG